MKKFLTLLALSLTIDAFGQRNRPTETESAIQYYDLQIKQKAAKDSRYPFGVEAKVRGPRELLYDESWTIENNHTRAVAEYLGVDTHLYKTVKVGGQKVSVEYALKALQVNSISIDPNGQLKINYTIIRKPYATDLLEAEDTPARQILKNELEKVLKKEKLLKAPDHNTSQEKIIEGFSVAKLHEIPAINIWSDRWRAPSLRGMVAAIYNPFLEFDEANQPLPKGFRVEKTPEAKSEGRKLVDFRTSVWHKGQRFAYITEEKSVREMAKLLGVPMRTEYTVYPPHAVTYVGGRTIYYDLKGIQLNGISIDPDGKMKLELYLSRAPEDFGLESRYQTVEIDNVYSPKFQHTFAKFHPAFQRVIQKTLEPAMKVFHKEASSRRCGWFF